MTMMGQDRRTDGSLPATSWVLRRFTANGVTAHMSSDVRAELTVDAAGDLVIESGFLRGTGRLAQGRGVVEFGPAEPVAVPGAPRVDCLEERIVRSCAGTFHADAGEGVLHLRRDGVWLEFAAAD